MHQLDIGFKRVERLLDEEAAAIGAMDSAGVFRLSEEKEALMAQLLACDFDRRPELSRRLARLTAAIRGNLILLVHAKACLQEVIESVTGRPSSYLPPGRNPANASGGQVSVTG